MMLTDKEVLNQLGSGHRRRGLRMLRDVEMCLESCALPWAYEEGLVRVRLHKPRDGVARLRILCTPQGTRISVDYGNTGQSVEICELQEARGLSMPSSAERLAELVATWRADLRRTPTIADRMTVQAADVEALRAAVAAACRYGDDWERVEVHPQNGQEGRAIEIRLARPGEVLFFITEWSLGLNPNGFSEKLESALVRSRRIARVNRSPTSSRKWLKIDICPPGSMVENIGHGRLSPLDRMRFIRQACSSEWQLLADYKHVR